MYITTIEMSEGDVLLVLVAKLSLYVLDWDSPLV